MKKTILTILLCGVIVLIIAGCGEKKNDERSFFGKIIEVAPSYIIVEPNENEEVRKSSDKLHINMIDPGFAYSVGDSVKVIYTGDIRESDPAQIKTTSVEIIEKEDTINYSKKVDEVTIELKIPKGWNNEELEEDSSYKFALKLWKDSQENYFTLYYYKEKFVVCGTGRSVESIDLNNGTVAEIGYYGVGKTWSDISFYDVNPYVALINNDTELEEIIDFIKNINIVYQNK